MKTNQPIPYADGSEKTVMSCLMRSNNLIDKALGQGVTEDSFYYPSHRELFSLLVDNYSNQRSNDLEMITRQIIDSGDDDKFGGFDGLAQIYSYSPTTQLFEQHLKILKDKQFLRESINLAEKVIASAYENENEEVMALLSEPVTKLQEIALGEHRSFSVNSALTDFYAKWEELVNGEREPALKTNLSGFDRLYGGLLTPAYIIVTALPSGGKTALAINLLLNLCKEGYRCLFFSLEMPQDQLMGRLVICESGIEGDKIANPVDHKPNKGDLGRVKRASQTISQQDFVIHDEGNMHIDKICAVARSHNRKKPLDVIFIDYAQLIRGTRQAGDNSEREYADISHKVQALRKELNCSIIVLSQVSKDDKGRVSPKYAKAFTDDTDLWVHIDKEQGQLEVKNIHICKCRHRGHTGKALDMTLNHATQQFVPLATHHTYDQSA